MAKNLSEFEIHVDPTTTVVVEGDKAIIEELGDEFREHFLVIQKNGKDVAVFRHFVGYAKL